MTVTVSKKAVEINIAPDKTSIHEIHDSNIIEYQPNQITVTFWHDDGSYHKTIPLHEILTLAGLE